MEGEKEEEECQQTRTSMGAYLIGKRIRSLKKR